MMQIIIQLLFPKWHILAEHYHKFLGNLLDNKDNLLIESVFLLQMLFHKPK